MGYSKTFFIPEVKGLREGCRTPMPFTLYLGHQLLQIPEIIFRKSKMVVSLAVYGRLSVGSRTVRHCILVLSDLFRKIMLRLQYIARIQIYIIHKLLHVFIKYVLPKTSNAT